MEIIMNENELAAAVGGAAQKQIIDTTEYVVKRGDTLDGIARRYGMSGWRELYNYLDNSRRVGPNPNLLQIGTVLKIPVFSRG